jgi:alkaline phosphatase
MNNKLWTGLCACAFLVLNPGTSALAQQENDSPAPAEAEQRNVILIIGDGMDDQQITIARNYLAGAEGRLLLDELPMRGAVQILAIENQVDGKPVYVSDSANTASSLATGEITSRGRISTRAGDNLAFPTIVEMAHQRGFRTGLVSTASVTDATPAAFAAHMSARLCQSPDLMQEVFYGDVFMGDCAQETKAQGGPGSISEQLAESKLDVILGGGSKYFTPLMEGSTSSTVLETARAAGFTTVASAAELSQVASTNRLLGLFSPDTMPVRMRGENGREAESPEPSWLNSIHHYLGDVTQPAVMVCEANPEFSGMPSLREMTDAALQTLDRAESPGFFLMIESASIDKQSHYRKPCGSIGELEQLNEALASALAFAASHPNTLVLVTADHSQAAQLVPMESLFKSFPIPIFTPGKLARIETPEGSLMAINYATNDFSAEEHTGANVPIFGNQEAVGRVPSFLSQPEIFELMRDYLQLD